MVDDDIEWEVGGILECRVTRKGARYKVRWKNSDVEQWLQEDHLRNCKEMVREFHSTRDQEIPDWAREDPELDDPGSGARGITVNLRR